MEQAHPELTFPLQLPHVLVLHAFHSFEKISFTNTNERKNENTPPLLHSWEEEEDATERRSFVSLKMSSQEQQQEHDEQHLDELLWCAQLRALEAISQLTKQIRNTFDVSVFLSKQTWCWFFSRLRHQSGWLHRRWRAIVYCWSSCSVAALARRNRNRNHSAR